MSTWKKALAAPDAPISEVIRAIDAGGIQIALIVDSKKRLLGTVTDGDVRRGILRGFPLTEKARRVMNKTPITANAHDSQDKVLSLMKSKTIHQVPLLDKKGVLIDIKILDELVQQTEKLNWVVLMAGGTGSRLKPLTDHTPKPMIEVGNQPILETILRNFIEHGFKKFYLSVNYKNEVLENYFGNGSKWGVSIRYIKEKTRLGTAGSLSLLPQKTNLPLIVMNADLLTNINFTQLLDFHGQNSSDATMCVREYDVQVPFGVVKIDKHHILKIDEKPSQRHFVNAGIYVLGPHALTQISKNAPMDMTTLFEKLIQKKRKVSAFPIREYWLDIGHMDDLKKAKHEYATVFE